MSYQDTLIWAKARLVTLRGDLYDIERDVVAYANALPSAIDAPVTDDLQAEAHGWKLSLDKAESALTYWIGNIQTEIDNLS